MTEYNTAQLRRAIKYDAKGTLEVKKKKEAHTPSLKRDHNTNSSMVSSLTCPTPLSRPLEWTKDLILALFYILFLIMV